MSIGQIDRYLIKRELGRGGMATVYLAEDPRFGRDVAIKILPLHTQDQKARGRFEREARTIAGLEHRAIVPVYDFGEDKEQLFLVMRLMTGGSLADRIRQGAMPLAEARVVLDRIASALDYAHHQGVIHRDLKPGNILFDQHNTAFLADFGIVKLLEAHTTFTGSAIVGTPAYISPEQVQGDRPIDRRADIYALGAILFEMLTGKMPYEAETPFAVLMKHATAPPPRLAEVNPNLPLHVQEVIDRAMAKNPDDRYDTAGEMVAALLNPARLTPTVEVAPPPRPQPIPTPLPPPPPRTRSRHGVWLLGGLLFLLLFGATMAISFAIASGYFRSTPTSEPPIAAITAATDEEATPVTPDEATPSATEEEAQEEGNAAATTLPTDSPETVATPTLADTLTPSPIPSPTHTPVPANTHTATPRPTTHTNTPRPTATATTVTPSSPGVVLNFESAAVSWRRGDQPYGEFVRSSEQVHGGSSAGKISYEFPAVVDNYVVFLAQPSLNISGEPTGISAWIYGDGSGHFLNIWIQDAAGEVRQYTFGRINFEGWVQLTAWFDEERGWPNQHISGTDDEKLTFPVRLQAIVLDGSPDEQESMGDIFIDDLVATAEEIP